MKKNFDETTEDLADIINPTTNEDEMKQLMQDLDREQAYREHKCWRQYITVLISIAFCAFQLYATLSGHIPAQLVRATHLAFVQALAFLLFPATKKMPRNTLPLYDVILAFVGAGAWVYYITNFEAIVRRAGAYTTLDIVIGVIGIIILFESCRRIVGLPIMIIAGAFILYAFIGKYLPEPSRLFSGTHYKPFVLYNGGHYGHANRCVFYVHIPVHSVWCVS